MFGLRFPKDYAETEQFVVGFIINRFCDPDPFFPLSKDVITRIFSKDFLYCLLNYSRDIAEGYLPNKDEIKSKFYSNGIEIKSLYTLVKMIGKFRKGLKLELRDIEVYKLSYDYVPPYYNSEEYRHLELLETYLSRLINYVMEL